MTLDEAIQHAEEVAMSGCTECHKEHGQLAEWLKDYREMKVHGTTNISDVAYCDKFVCEKCGIVLEDWVKSVYDEDAEDTTHCEYEFKFCPNCGRKIVEG